MYHNVELKNQCDKSGIEGIFVPLIEKMRKRRIIPEYRKNRRFNELFGVPKQRSKCKSLFECLLEVFPSARPTELKKWIPSFRNDQIETELLLFISLVCGSHFRIEHIKLESMLEELHDWLMSLIQNNITLSNPGPSPELIEFVVAALAPGIKAAIEEKGYRQGWPYGEYVKKKGRPLETRGVWVAALVIVHLLRKSGMKAAAAKDKALELAAVLLGRGSKEIGHNEFYRFAKKAPKEVITKLTECLVGRYNSELRMEGARVKDYEPPIKQEKAYAQWRARHKGLDTLFRENSGENAYVTAITMIPDEVWKALWKI